MLVYEKKLTPDEKYKNHTIIEWDTFTPTTEIPENTIITFNGTSLYTYFNSIPETDKKDAFEKLSSIIETGFNFDEGGVLADLLVFYCNNRYYHLFLVDSNEFTASSYYDNFSVHAELEQHEDSDDTYVVEAFDYHDDGNFEYEDDIVHRKLYGNYTGSVPTESDEELTYKLDGIEIEINSGMIKVNNMIFLDDTHGGIIARSRGDDEVVDGALTVFIGEDQIIPKPAESEPEPEPELESIAVTTLPNKTGYDSGELLDLTGMVVTATYSDGTESVVSDYTTNPANGEKITEGEPVQRTVLVSYEGKTTTFTIKVDEPAD